MDDPYACVCGRRMVKRSCRLDADRGLLIRYLTCPCGTKRTLLVEPEKILDVLYLQQKSPAGSTAIPTAP